MRLKNGWTDDIFNHSMPDTVSGKTVIAGVPNKGSDYGISELPKTDQEEGHDFSKVRAIFQAFLIYSVQ